MKKSFMYVVVTFAALLAGTAFGAAADNPVLRIMPLGDSITHGSQSVRGNGYRAPLYVALTNLGYNVDYVGTQTDNYSKEDPFLADSDHEGHSGWKIENASNGIYDFIPEFFSQIDDPHVILLHIGTNDTGDGEPAFRSEATNRLVRLLDRIHECQPSAKVVVTTLMRPTSRRRGRPPTSSTCTPPCRTGTRSPTPSIPTTWATRTWRTPG